ncbi:MAG TPA: hypothetical protein VFE47_04500 [Tepidisphaeraceae bacterium]|nr:hypothetical protein [Tepidisphaeraceae bacterium]
MKPSLLTIVAPLPLWLFASACTARAEVPAAPATPQTVAVPAQNLFDPARHMHVSEVKPGMTGYGLTVFHGTKIEKFNVEVLSVLKNFNPKCDVVLIRCKGDYLEHTGSIAGMSGSPIFLTDAAGHDRMIGAFAYGWPLTKDPVAGVQPIEYMLRLPFTRTSDESNVKPTAVTVPGAAVALPPAHTGPAGHSAWSMADAGMLPVAWQKPGAWQMTSVNQSRSTSAGHAGDRSTGMLGDEGMPRLEPLATPLMTSGLSPQLFEELAPRFRAAGLVPLQAGIGGSAPAGAGDDSGNKLAPGGVLAVPLLTGDMEMTAIGTVTEVIGDHVWGFGHPFNNEGPVSLPMGAGYINGVIANLNTSFKLGSLTQARGTLTTDGSVGVAGLSGQAPVTIPIDIVVHPADGSGERAYHFNASRHPKFTPLISAAAFSAAVSGSSELPPLNTVDYDMVLSFTNGQTVSLSNRAVNANSGDLFGDAGVVMQAASDNPFQRVMVKKITGTVKVRATAESATIVDVNVPKSHYHPGDKVKAFVTYQPFRGAEGILPVELELPHDLPHGHYQLVISDAQRYFTDEQQSKPFRFTAENIGDVFSVLKDVAAIRENAIYVRLVQRPDGVAIGHTALSRLPSSRREILLASGRSNTTPFISSTVKIVPTDLVMSGASEFAIEVEAASKAVVGAPRGIKVEPPAQGGKSEEPKKTPPVETPGKKESPKDNTPAK